jgi:hypothetical protein
MSHNTLENYYKTVFALQYHHHFQNVEDMIPFEKDIYESLLRDYIETKNEEALQESLRQKALIEQGMR